MNWHSGAAAFWYWFFVGPALALALASLRGIRSRARYVARRLAEEPPKPPAATVIVPVKGEDCGLRENLAALDTQDYPIYELIIVAQEAADIPPGVLPARARVVLAHGDDPETGEKVRNLMAAVKVASHRSRILAFADSDGRVGPGWLRALAAPLAETGVGASTGYRWYLPEPESFWHGLWSLLRGVWDAVSGGMLGAGDCPFAWGGSMAIRKETFFEAGVFDYWKGAVSDDYALTAAMRAAGLSIAYAPGALVPSYEGISAGAFFEWSRRQLTLTRVYRPRLWFIGLVAHIFYCGAMVASVTVGARGHRGAWVALAAQLAPGMWKGFERSRLARAALRGHDAWFRRYGWAHTVLTPVASWLWLEALVASAFGTQIRWRGNRYELKRRWR